MQKNSVHCPDRLLRVRQILEIIPVSRATWWRGIREGRFPAGTKLGPKTTVWKESEIMAMVNGKSA